MLFRSENPAAPSLKDADPDNRMLSRFNRRRLTVEELRDGLLAIDGTLDLTMGGTLQSGRGTDGENNQGRLSIKPESQNAAPCICRCAARTCRRC